MTAVLKELIAPDLDDPTVRTSIIDDARRGLVSSGVACIPGFLTEHALDACCVEALELETSAHHQDIYGSAYLGHAGDESYDRVAAVLGGGRAGVTSVPMTPGTLMLFEGRNSLHRVTTIRGSQPRLVALLAFDTLADTDSSELLKLVRYGRLP